MTKTLKLMLGLALASTLFACKKSQEKEHEDSLKTYNEELRKITSVLGRKHNEGVAIALTQKRLSLKNSLVLSTFPNSTSPTTPAPSHFSASDIRQLANSIYSYVDSQPEFVGLTSEPIPDSQWNTIISIIKSPSYLTIDSKMDSTLSVLDANNLITQRESDAMKALADIFTDGYALNMNQSAAGTYFANRLNILKSQYSNTVWNINEGELFLGTLEIAIGSNEYWHANGQAPLSSSSFTSDGLIAPPPTPLDPELPIVQIDLVAYAATWGWQVLSGFIKGNLNEKDQWDRIHNAFGAAIIASTLKIVDPMADPIDPSMINNQNTAPSNGIVNLVYTFQIDELIPDLETNSMIYCSSIGEINDGIVDPYKPIFLDPNQYLYSSSNFLTHVPDGYYKFDEATQNYYKIVGGKALSIYQWIH